MSGKEAVAFVERHGIVLESARGPVPSLAEEIAGAQIRGSWWAHPQGKAIFRATQFVSASPDVLVCKLIDGKVTYLHRRLWPALVKLASRFAAKQLARTWNEHTADGSHAAKEIPFPRWVPSDVLSEAEDVSVDEAERMLQPVIGAAKSPHPRRRRSHSG